MQKIKLTQTLHTFNKIRGTHRSKLKTKQVSIYLSEYKESKLMTNLFDELRQEMLTHVELEKYT